MYKFVYGFLLVIVLGSSGCSDWLDVQPKTSVPEEDLFADEFGFECRELNVEKFNKALSANELGEIQKSMGAIGQNNAFDKTLRKVASTNVQLKQSNKLLNEFGVTMANTVSGLLLLTLLMALLRVFKGPLNT